MPTGTGKTGVIACLTRLSVDGSSLVLTPWANLRNQMLGDLEKGFFDKVGIAPKDMEVVTMLPSTAAHILNSDDPRVIIATFATLNDLRINHASTYEEVANTVSLVVVDEGHYEPAVEWCKSVKGLKTKTLLLTATPYRNDLKLFRIADPQRSTHHFTHESAVKAKIIRQLRCEELASPTGIPALSAAFAERWKGLKKGNALPSRSPRAIVCCSGHEDIEVAVAHLRQAGLSAIGIHERFGASTDPVLLKAVPDPTTNEAEIWVHQHKLTEGLDDSRFCCVALFTQIRNDRKLIQQIGRALRRDRTDRERPALLIAPRAYSAESEWDAYLKFETELRLLDPEHFRDVVDVLLNAQPEVEYFEGRFRRRFRPDDLSIRPQVIIPPSVLVRHSGNDFSLDGYIEDCTDTLNTEDAVILGPDVNAPCQRSTKSALWVYASVRNSRFLQKTSLYEIKLETHCVVVSDGLVFMTDSRGNYPSEYLERHTTGLGPEQLARFLDGSIRPTNVSVSSSIPYDTVVRAAELRAHNLLRIPASLTDRVHICRSARGSSAESGRRYVGLNSGRVRREVSEEKVRSFDLSTFISWAESVAAVLVAEAGSSLLFQRYMPTCTPPVSPVPRHICLDLQREDLGLALADGRECSLKSSSSDVRESPGEKRPTYTCSFGLEGDRCNDETISLRIDYYPTKQRFWFNKLQGAAVQVAMEADGEPSNKSLAEFLNQRQDMVLIGLRGGEIVYQGRNFYRVDYSHVERTLLGLLQRPAGAPECRSEKGSRLEIAQAQARKLTRFPDGSLFRTIADQAIELPFRDELLICDDMATECADFVAANFGTQQLAFVHAKAGGGHKVSASAFHDVVAQAMKNLVYLTPNQEVPQKVMSWSRRGRWNGTGIPRLYRSPAGLPSCKSLWRKLRSEIIESSSPGLYVILVTTGCCDLGELRRAVCEPTRRTAEIAQLLHLLDGLNGYARQLGVRLAVYDLPYAGKAKRRQARMPST